MILQMNLLIYKIFSRGDKQSRKNTTAQKLEKLRKKKEKNIRKTQQFIKSIKIEE